MDNNVNVNIIVAVGSYILKKGYPIGKDGKIPWHCKNDLKWFKETTMGHPVIMGRKTYESIGKPLVGRHNIIVSRTIEIDGPNCTTVTSLEDAIEIAKNRNEGDVFIIGGESIYKEAIEKDLVDFAYVDFLNEFVVCADKFFPALELSGFEPYDFEPIVVEEDYAFAVRYIKKRGVCNNVDKQYLSVMKDILENGTLKKTRAGDTLSLFGVKMEFDLHKGLPLLTTKKVFYKGIIHELLWFLKGDTNIKYLVDNGVHIWDDDAYRHYLQLLEKNRWLYFNGKPHKRKNAFSKEVFVEMVKQERILQMEYYRGDREDYYKFGDLGPIYGKQWRDWNGIDQLNNIIETLKTNPDDRRLLLSAWNVGELNEMGLPPCHVLYQFYTSEMNDAERYAWCERNNITDIFNENGSFNEGIPERKLSCMFNMRSNDFCCGNPFNIAEASMLTYIIANICNMDADMLIYIGGDVHIYTNHIDMAKEQLNRIGETTLPVFKIKRKLNSIDDIKFEDFDVVGYNPKSPIKYKLNVG